MTQPQADSTETSRPEPTRYRLIGVPDVYDEPVQCARCGHWAERRACRDDGGLICVVCQRSEA